MKSDNIKYLLDKFYRGETSPDQEKLLADFMLQDDVSAEFLPDQKLFLALREQSVEISQESSRKIEQLIDSFKDENTSAKRPKPIGIKYWAIGTAASLALVLVLGITQFQKNRQAEPIIFADTYKNPEDAYKATVAAMQLFSDNFAKGTTTVERANVRLEEAQKIINKSIK